MRAHTPRAGFPTLGERRNSPPRLCTRCSLRTRSCVTSAARARGATRAIAELLDYIYESANVRPHGGWRYRPRAASLWTTRNDTAGFLRGALSPACSPPPRSIAWPRLAGAPKSFPSPAAICAKPSPSPHSVKARWADSSRWIRTHSLSSWVRREWSHRGVEVREGSGAQRHPQTDATPWGNSTSSTRSGSTIIFRDDAGATPSPPRAWICSRPEASCGSRTSWEDLWSSGYMEAVMDWWLVYRNEEKLLTMAAQTDRAKLASVRTFREPAQKCGDP